VEVISELKCGLLQEVTPYEPRYHDFDLNVPLGPVIALTIFISSIKFIFIVSKQSAGQQTETNTSRKK
jgi:hypothetical protein